MLTYYGVENQAKHQFSLVPLLAQRRDQVLSWAKGQMLNALKLDLLTYYGVEPGQAPGVSGLAAVQLSSSMRWENTECCPLQKDGTVLCTRTDLL